MYIEIQRELKSISKLNEISLPNLVVITGLNGSGKTHLLQGISNQYFHLKETKILDDGDTSYFLISQKGRF